MVMALPCVACAAACRYGAVTGLVFAQSVATDEELERASSNRAVRVGTAAGRVAAVPMEVYVARVLAGEGEPNAPAATQQALAIAIRTFAVANAGRHGREGFDLCDTTHCQVLRASTPAARQAALATAGQVLTYGGAVAEIFNSASCGGRTETASEVWPGADLPYLHSIIDDVHRGDEPWTLDLSLRQIDEALTRAGFGGNRLTGITVDTRSGSGRATRLRLDGMRPDVIAGESFRAAIGARQLRSTQFVIERRRDTVRFTGTGYGHGVGLCVIGAGRRGRRGESAADILHVYFPGLALTSLAPATQASGSIPPRAPLLSFSNRPV
jgi:stage II sporulation protein D